MSRLTDEQKAIVAHPGGPAAVIAVPGSGKTTALLGLINNLKARGQDPRRVLCVTFTKAAADQMRPRLTVRTGDEWARLVDFRTLHSFAFKILAQAGVPVHSHVIEDSGQYLRRAMQVVGLKNTDTTAVESMATDLTRYIGNLRPVSFVPQTCHRPQFDQVLKLYHEHKQSNGLFDMDDLVERAVQCLEGDAELQAYWRDRYDWRLVDEHQDTSRLQLRLLDLVTPSKSPNLVVAGDDDQAVYSWRGGTNEGLLQFKRQYPDAVIYQLSLTHRCPAEILEPAARLIANNRTRYPKALRTEKSGGTVELLYPADAAHELELIANRLIEWHRAGEEMRRFAVLYRTNAQALGLISRLEEAGVPYYQLGGSKDPFARWMSKDVLSYFRVAFDQGDYEDLERIIRRPQREGLATKEGKFLMVRALQKAQTPMGALAWIAENAGFLERATAKGLLGKLTTLRDLKAGEAIPYILSEMEYGRGIETYCKWSGSDQLEAIEHVQALSLLAKENDPCAVFLELAARPNRRPKRHHGVHTGVCLSSLHSSKGLEWRTVYVVGAVSVNHPRQSGEGVCDVEEERRLLFVGMTRAKEELVISAPRKWGQDASEPSLFLAEAGLVEKRRKLGQGQDGRQHTVQCVMHH